MIDKFTINNNENTLGTCYVCLSKETHTIVFDTISSDQVSYRNVNFESNIAFSAVFSEFANYLPKIKNFIVLMSSLDL